MIEDAIGVFSGRDCDTLVLLVWLLDGSRRLVCEDPCMETGPDTDILATLKRRPDAYRRAADDTEAFLERVLPKLALDILENVPSLPPEPGDEVPEETDR